MRIGYAGFIACRYARWPVGGKMRLLLMQVYCKAIWWASLQVRQVACGGMHSLALTEGGEVWTWGEPWGDFSLYLDRNPRQVRLG